MTALPTLRDILNNTPANAVDVDWNFDTLASFIGQELINRDGSVSMNQPLNLAGPAPSSPTHAATKGYVDAATPLGAIMAYAGSASPTGWAMCDGSSKSTTDPAYAALFAVIGYTYGGSGAAFNLPDLRARFPVGRSAGDALFGTLNNKGGTRDAVLPSHQHTGSTGLQSADHAHNANHGHTAWSGTESADHVHSATTDAQGFHDHQVSGSGLQFWFYGSPATGTLGMDTAGTGHSGAPSDIAGAGVRTGTTPAHQHNLTTGGRSAAHTHPITVDGNNFNTGGVTANHNHAFTSDAAGVAPANQNLPPYITINYIIRIGV